MTQWNTPGGDDPPRRGDYGQEPDAEQTRRYEQAPGYAQQQPYGQQEPYGQQQYGYGQQQYAQPGAFERSRSYGIVGTVLTLLGGIAVLVSFTALDWYGNGTFSDIRSSLSDNANANGFAKVYFGWLGWVALIIVVVAGVLASFPTPALRICRIIGIVVGIAMSGLTFLAIDFSGNSTGYSDYLKNAQIGFYFAVAGFLLAGIGAGIGPRRG
jgi:hypothetical protein